MAAIGQIGVWRHAVVGATIVAGSALTFAGVIGAPKHPERFDAKQILVVPAGADGVRIREVVDQDFGSNDKHGYQRIIPNDFGVPTDIQASSPDAPAEVNVEQLGDETQIRLGDPNQTVTGQHRYILSYTLPNARISTGQLNLDLVSAGTDAETLDFEGVVAGMTLANPGCSTGAAGGTGGCTLAQSGDTWRTTIAPLPADAGVTISGTVTAVGAPADVPIPAVPARRSEGSTVPLGIAMIPIGLASGGAVYELSRRRGRNEVYAGGAADAAYGLEGGPLPPPGSPPPPTRLVPDSQMAALATTEFAPPKGIDPWQGNVLLREDIGQESVSAWFYGMIALEVIAVDDTRKPALMGIGPKFAAADPQTQSLVGPVLGAAPMALGSYNPAFAQLWGGSPDCRPATSRPPDGGVAAHPAGAAPPVEPSSPVSSARSSSSSSSPAAGSCAARR